MKKRFKIIIGLLVVCGACLVGAACAPGSYYDGFTEKGQTIKVCYDRNGGVFASVANIDLVDVYPGSAFENGGIKLIAPGDPVRGDESKGGSSNALSLSIASRSGYLLAGWYRERAPRVDDKGNMIDDYGNVTTDPEKQGCVYSGKWDFENDIFALEEGKDYTANETALTLYAAWIPEFKYTFVSDRLVDVTDDKGKPTGEKKYATAEYLFNPELQSGDFEMTLPYYSPAGGAMLYGNFPKISVDNVTFDKIYTDSEHTDEITGGKIQHSGTFDLEHGIAVNPVSTFYTSWKDGEWFKIKNASQLSSNARINGCYEIYEDLDFSELSWPAAFSSGNFRGKFLGIDGVKKISGVKVFQSDISQTYGGLFSRISADAEFSDINFENATYSLEKGSRIQGSSFGLFAGNIDGNAKLENISVSGKIIIGNIYVDSSHPLESYNIGLVNGNISNVDTGISCENIACESDVPEKIVCTVEANGNVVLSRPVKPEE